MVLDGEPLVDEARDVVDAIERDPRPYLVPELFMTELLVTAARLACTWKLPGYDPIYVALASLTGGVWLTADARAAARVRRRGLVRVLGR